MRLSAASDRGAAGPRRRWPRAGGGSGTGRVQAEQIFFGPRWPDAAAASVVRMAAWSRGAGVGIVVTTRVLGRGKPLLGDFEVPPPREVEGGDDVRLRDVIEHVVAEQVVRFCERREAERWDRVLTARQIEEGAARGKVDPAGRETGEFPDVEEAVGAALQAFRDGLYLVVLDGTERRDLEERVHLHEDSRLVFIRLTFLAGG